MKSHVLANVWQMAIYFCRGTLHDEGLSENLVKDNSNYFFANSNTVLPPTIVILIMKISKIEICNYRLLRNFSLDLEDDLSLVIGKNNSGKTSLLSALEKFVVEKNKITLDDFNTSLREKLCRLISGGEPIPDEDKYIPIGMQLKITIKYGEKDDLGQVSALIMSLDPEDDLINLGFEYNLSYSQLVAFCTAYQEEKENYDNDALLYASEMHEKYFGGIVRKSYLSGDFTRYTDLSREKISLEEVLSFRSISAKRNVTNKNNDKTLSGQTAKIYKRTEETEEQKETVNLFKKKLRIADKDLSTVYQSMFAKLLGSVEKFGGVSHAETSLTIASTLQHRELLEGNTTVLYRHDEHDLPEHFNGLGYMNLISMIFEIDLLMTSFRRAINQRPAAINLLFIEEPEAHTHPQMQYVFIKNIKSLLAEGIKREDGVSVNLQTVISTHSSHIVAECDFYDIKYMKRCGGEVHCKSLKSLKDDYLKANLKDGAEHFRFLKQYLTLHRAELFFADKAILVEGDTEKILLPAMMKKLDQEYSVEGVPPLLSQNISLVEVGAHSQIFEKFIRFIGIKTLILTDIDTGKTIEKPDDKGGFKKSTEKCPPLDLETDHTTNNALCFFYGKERQDIKFFLGLEKSQKALAYQEGWTPDVQGELFVGFQTEEDGYCGRSFEDAFFSINKDFLGKEPSKFPSLIAKHFKLYVDGAYSPHDFAEKAVDKKAALAIDILLNSEASAKSMFSNWKTPAYIQEGLEWLRS
ncbi:ATP-dependent nuclease [Pseudomonas chlororaphis]|uniref:ATP-dependent nuclease n=1 Tax=Pseudomonas chlororaphis TaxID=587753 RepID=UPI0039E500D0